MGPTRAIEPTAASGNGGSNPAQQPSGKIGRNDPCYCGSGKKYKKCHGR